MDNSSNFNLQISLMVNNKYYRELLNIFDGRLQTTAFFIMNVPILKFIFLQTRTSNE